MRPQGVKTIAKILSIQMFPMKRLHLNLMIFLVSKIVMQINVIAHHQYL